MVALWRVFHCAGGVAPIDPFAYRMQILTSSLYGLPESERPCSTPQYEPNATALAQRTSPNALAPTPQRLNYGILTLQVVGHLFKIQGDRTIEDQG